ncbi:hypothetical protein EBZ35_08240, partial [bacterium]|nr:hypothetical protein [bacterium]
LFHQLTGQRWVLASLDCPIVSSACDEGDPKGDSRLHRLRTIRWSHRDSVGLIHQVPLFFDTGQVR